MWKIVLIEILGNSIWVLVLISVALAFATLFYGVYHAENGIKLNINRVKVFLISSVLCMSMAILMPSKKFMYVALGATETISFLQNNEEAKKISSKTIQLINKKLDDYLIEE